LFIIVLEGASFILLTFVRRLSFWWYAVFGTAKNVARTLHLTACSSSLIVFIFQLKIFLYMVFVGGEDEETQRNGIVMLFWPGSRELLLPASKHRGLVQRAFTGVPTRFASFHFCFPSTPFFQMARMMISITLKSGNGITRVKVHTGR
jgi:hypothetical protein